MLYVRSCKALLNELCGSVLWELDSKRLSPKELARLYVLFEANLLGSSITSLQGYIDHVQQEASFCLPVYIQ